jgi:putative ABC transport system permease protein
MRDIRYALRTLSSTPAVTFTALLVLALGIGATAAIFTVANRVLLRPLPLAKPERLVQLGTVGILEFQAYREQSRSFESLVSYSALSKTLRDGAEPERVTAVATERGLFDLLGVRPLAGRTFSDIDSTNLAVVSEVFWKRRFAARTSLENWTIALDGEPYTVIGVMPANFEFPYAAARTDVWITTDLPRTGSWFQRIDVAVGRLKENVTLETAAAELRAIAQRLEPLSQSNTTRRVTMTPLTEAVVGRSRKGILLLLGAAAMILLIACANVANLLLARAESRKREVAVRMALGAGRGRLVRQFLTESILLALVASAGALFVAIGSVRLLMAFAGTQIPRAFEVGLDWTVFLFLLAIGVGTGIAFGLMPALYSLKSDVSGTLNSQGARSSRGRNSTSVTNGLVVGEIALAFVLLSGAGLLLRAFLFLEQAPAGLTADHVLTLRMETRGLGLPETPPAETHSPMTAQGRYFREIEDRVREIAGVRDAGFVTRLHIQVPGFTGQFTIPGRPMPPDRRGFPARLRDVSPGYFRALGIPLRAGRIFTDRDPGIVVNETLVREHFPGEDPIGRVLDRGTIIGVVGDVRQSLRLPPEPEIFSPLARTQYSAATLVVNSPLPSLTLVGPVRAAIRDINPNQAVFDVRTMDDVIMSSHGDLNLSLWLIGLFAGLAVLLAMAGIYGVVSYNVAARRKEFGIRLALGADAGRLLWLVFVQGGFLAGSGVLIGIAGALGLTRLLRTLLYEVTPTDPLTFIVTTLLLVGVAVVSSLVPARRAMNVDPMTVLRDE